METKVYAGLVEQLRAAKTLEDTVGIATIAVAAAVADERQAILKIAEGELMEVHEAGEERIVKSIIEQISARGAS